MPDSRDLELLIHGHVPIITIETHEETRALNLVVKASRTEFLPTFKWTVTDGLQRLDLSLDPQRHVSDHRMLLNILNHPACRAYISC